jgi:hypothetical protein
MTVSASIAFTQGATVGAPGVAIIGVDGTAVVVSNGNNLEVVTWQFTIVDVPVASALPTGIVQTGASPTYTFTPDVAGGYLVLLTVFDVDGNFATDYRVFQVPETSGRIIPPFKSTDQSLNFIISSVMNTRGWALFQDAYNKEVDVLSAGGSFTPGGDLAGSATSQEVIGLLSHALPSLSSGYLNWTGSAWALSSVTGGVTAVTGTSPIASSGGTTPVISFSISGQTQGDLVYYNGTSWVRLPAGTTGYVLQTNGTSANPSWVSNKRWITRPILAGIASTPNTSTNPLVAGYLYFKPGDEASSRTCFFRVVLETTNASYQANVALVDINNVFGGGAGAIIPGTTQTTTSTTPVELEVELNTSGGNFETLASNILVSCIVWLSTAGAGQIATVGMASINVNG